jgi:hypothetical protein
MCMDLLTADGMSSQFKGYVMAHFERQAGFPATSALRYF